MIPSSSSHSPSLPLEVATYITSYLEPRDRKQLLSVDRIWRAAALEMVRIDVADNFERKKRLLEMLLKSFKLTAHIEWLANFRPSLRERSISSLKDLYITYKTDEKAVVDRLRDINHLNLGTYINPFCGAALNLNLIEKGRTHKNKKREKEYVNIGIHRLIDEKQYLIALENILALKTPADRQLLLERLYSEIKKYRSFTPDTAYMTEQLAQVGEKLWSLQFQLFSGRSRQEIAERWLETEGALGAVKLAFNKNLLDPSQLLCSLIKRIPVESLEDVVPFILKRSDNNEVKETIICRLVHHDLFSDAVEIANNTVGNENDKLSFIILKASFRKHDPQLLQRIAKNLSNQIYRSKIYTRLAKDYLVQNEYKKAIQMANRIKFKYNQTEFLTSLAKQLVMQEVDTRTCKRIIGKLSKDFDRDFFWYKIKRHQKDFDRHS